MNNNFRMRSKKERERDVTAEKVRRDGTIMYMEARYVIVLDKEGNVVERINRSKTYLANYLVVLAPVVYKDVHIPLAIALEIGIGRSGPYRAYERSDAGGKVSTIANRFPVLKLTHGGVRNLLPVIASSLQSIVDIDTSHWKNLTYEVWRKGQSNIVPNGKFFYIPMDELLLLYLSLEKDFLSRKRGHLAEFVAITKEHFGTLKYAIYRRGELKRLSVAKKCAQMLVEATYPPHFVEAVRSMLGKETTKYRALFEQVVEEFKIRFPKAIGIDLLYLKLRRLYARERKALLPLFPLSVVTHTESKREKRNALKRKTERKHGKNSLRIEIHPSKEVIAQRTVVAQPEASKGDRDG